MSNVWDMAFAGGAAAPSRPRGGNRAQFEPIAREVARRHGVPEELFVRQITQESGWNPQAVSPAGARGIAQIMPNYHPTAKPDDPAAALEYAARLMAGHYRRFGSWDLALAAYNAGSGAVERAGGVPPYRETQNYVRSIAGDSQGGSAYPEPRPLPPRQGRATAPDIASMVGEGEIGRLRDQIAARAALSPAQPIENPNQPIRRQVGPLTFVWGRSALTGQPQWNLDLGRGVERAAEQTYLAVQNDPRARAVAAPLIGIAQGATAGLVPGTQLPTREASTSDILRELRPPQDDGLAIRAAELAGNVIGYAAGPGRITRPIVGAIASRIAPPIVRAVGERIGPAVAAFTANVGQNAAEQVMVGINQAIVNEWDTVRAMAQQNPVTATRYVLDRANITENAVGGAAWGAVFDIAGQIVGAVRRGAVQRADLARANRPTQQGTQQPPPDVAAPPQPARPPQPAEPPAPTAASGPPGPPPAAGAVPVPKPAAKPGPLGDMVGHIEAAQRRDGRWGFDAVFADGTRRRMTGLPRMSKQEAERAAEALNLKYEYGRFMAGEKPAPVQPPGTAKLDIGGVGAISADMAAEAARRAERIAPPEPPPAVKSPISPAQAARQTPRTAVKPKPIPAPVTTQAPVAKAPAPEVRRAPSPEVAPVVTKAPPVKVPAPKVVRAKPVRVQADIPEVDAPAPKAEPPTKRGGATEAFLQGKHLQDPETGRVWRVERANADGVRVVDPQTGGDARSVPISDVARWQVVDEAAARPLIDAPAGKPADLELAGQDVKKPAPDVGKQQGLDMSPPKAPNAKQIAIDEADRALKAEHDRHRPIADAYREGKIGDAEFMESRARVDRAMEKWEDARGDTAFGDRRTKQIRREAGERPEAPKAKGEFHRAPVEGGGERIWYTKGKDVYVAPSSNVPDIRNGYLQGRWESTVENWNKPGGLAEALGLPKVPEPSVPAKAASPTSVSSARKEAVQLKRGSVGGLVLSGVDGKPGRIYIPKSASADMSPRGQGAWSLRGEFEDMKQFITRNPKAKTASEWVEWFHEQGVEGQGYAEGGLDTRRGDWFPEALRQHQRGRFKLPPSGGAEDASASLLERKANAEAMIDAITGKRPEHYGAIERIVGSPKDPSGEPVDVDTLAGMFRHIDDRVEAWKGGDKNRPLEDFADVTRVVDEAIEAMQKDKKLRGALRGAEPHEIEALRLALHDGVAMRMLPSLTGGSLGNAEGVILARSRKRGGAKGEKSTAQTTFESFMQEETLRRAAMRKPLEIPEDRLDAIRKRMGKPGGKAAGMDVERVVRDMTLSEHAESMLDPYTSRGLMTSLWDRAVRSMQGAIGRTKPGRELVDSIDTWRKSFDQYRGRVTDDLKFTQAWSDKEWSAIRDALEAGERPAGKMGAAYDAFRTFFNRVLDEADALDLDVHAVENFWPQIPNERLVLDPRTKAEVIQRMIDNGWAKNAVDAEKKLAEEIRGHMGRDRRAPNLEIPRSAEIPHDLRLAAKHEFWKYVNQVARRITQVDEFGRADARAAQMVSRIRDAGGDPELATVMYLRSLGIRVERTLMDAIGNELSAFGVLRFMGRSTIGNMGQTAHTAIVAGLRPTMRAIMASFRNKEEYGHFLRRAGVTVDYMIRDVLSDMTGVERGVELPIMSAQEIQRFTRWLPGKGGKFLERALVRAIAEGPMSKRADQFLHWTGFNKSEIVGRSWAGWAGREAALEAFERLKKNANRPADRRLLEKLGIGVDGALTAGRLTEQQLADAAYHLSERTFFTYSPKTFPEFWTGTWYGRLWAQFRKHVYSTGRMMFEEVVQEARKGNAVPLARMAVTMPIVGDIVGTILASLSGRERADLSGEASDKGIYGTDWGKGYPSWMVRYVEGLFNAAGAGLVADMFLNMARGPMKTMEWWLGAVPADVANLSSRAYQTIKDEWQIQRGGGPRERRGAVGLARDLSTSIPFAGTAISRNINTSRQDYLSLREDALRAYDRRDYGAFARKNSELGKRFSKTITASELRSYERDKRRRATGGQAPALPGEPGYRGGR